MKFKCNVAPLVDCMNLAIINSNISKFYEKSTVVELTVDGSTLTLNTQATSLTSEASVRGDNVDGSSCSAIVDCVLLKQLVSGLTSNDVTFDFQDNCVVVMSGRSKFTVPKLLTDEEEASLDKPLKEEELANVAHSELHPDVWKTIQDHQLYAIASSQIHKVYTRVWVSKEKGVLTGDPNNSVFTYQPESDLVNSCLVSSTIVNLLASLEAGARIYCVSDTVYVVYMDVDSFSFCSQFTVDLEDESTIGTYESDMIFDMVLDESQQEFEVSKSSLTSTAKQASLFASASNPFISVVANNNGVRLVNDNVNCQISSDPSQVEYEAQFILSDLDSVVSHMTDDSMFASPIVKEGEVFGLRFRSGSMVALLGGVE